MTGLGMCAIPCGMNTSAMQMFAKGAELYHGTSLANAESILREGIRLAGPNRRGYVSAARQVALNKGGSQMFRADAGAQVLEPVVFVVDARKAAKLVRLHGSRDMTGAQNYYFEKPLPPAAFKRVEYYTQQVAGYNDRSSPVLVRVRKSVRAKTHLRKIR